MTARHQAALKEERKKKRMARLEECLKAQRFIDWSITHRDRTGGNDDASTVSNDILINPLWYVPSDAQRSRESGASMVALANVHARTV
jgi:hypothetical protein